MMIQLPLPDGGGRIACSTIKEAEGYLRDIRYRDGINRAICAYLKQTGCEVSCVIVGVSADWVMLNDQVILEQGTSACDMILAVHVVPPFLLDEDRSACESACRAARESLRHSKAAAIEIDGAAESFTHLLTQEECTRMCTLLIMKIVAQVESQTAVALWQGCFVPGLREAFIAKGCQVVLVTTENILDGMVNTQC